MLHPFATPIRRAKGRTGIMIDYAVSTTKNLTRAQSAHIRPAEFDCLSNRNGVLTISQIGVSM